MVRCSYRINECCRYWSQEGLQLVGLVKVGQLADAAHESVQEEQPLLDEQLVLLAHGLLGRDRWHIQADKARVESLAELVEFAESSENLEFTIVILSPHLVHVMRTVLDGGLGHRDYRRLMLAKTH